MPSEIRWLPLQRELYSVSIDALTGRETRRGFLPAGTWVEDPDRVLQQAAVERIELVTLRSRDTDGAVGLERVDKEALRRAVAP